MDSITWKASFVPRINSGLFLWCRWAVFFFPWYMFWIVLSLNEVLCCVQWELTFLGWSIFFGSFFLVEQMKSNLPQKFWSTLHNNTDKACGTWSFVDQNIETSRVLNLHSELQIYFLCKTFYQWKLSIFSLRYTCICMVISNIDRLSLILRGHLYLTHKTLLVPQRFFYLMMCIH